MILAIQPDASQATAFAGAAGVALLMQERRGPRWWLLASSLALLAALAWTRPDPLDPVPHVEGIVGLAFDLGGLWPHLAILSLLALPMPFLVAAFRSATSRADAAALATYYGVLCVMPAVGSFPVPLMGFGLSPLLGYYVGLVWLAVHARVLRATGAARPTLET